MRQPRMLGRALAALALAGGAVVAAAPNVGAVTSVDLQCESGGGKFYCFAYNDAVAPATIRWVINGVAISALDDRVFTGQRPCGAPVPNIQVTVSDATGSVTTGGPMSCNYGPWP